ncbi:MAG: DEAD/DEAH box helicase, partial [Emcibacteraceae bacterium]|nr:DEAD/DEAH box helicase [Emcibacteraceae bacterium]
MNVNPINMYEYVREAYERYYDSAFWMREPLLMKERSKLLEQSNTMSKEPLIECVLPYPANVEIQDACEKAGLSNFVSDNLGKVVFGENFKLREHQSQALITSIKHNDKNQSNFVVTSGTGSGKTETFLLPIVARLLADKERGLRKEAPHKWWKEGWSSQEKWAGLRKHSHNKPQQAVRTLILYPTNALVEDQIARLRQCAFRALELFDEPLFYFGRYTGATAGGKYYPPSNLKAADRKKIKNIADELRKIDNEAEDLQHKSLETRGQFSDPNCGEMLTRWDMIESPPDILISNI